MLHITITRSKKLKSWLVTKDLILLYRYLSIFIWGFNNLFNLQSLLYKYFRHGFQNIMNQSINIKKHFQPYIRGIYIISLRCIRSLANKLEARGDNIINSKLKYEYLCLSLKGKVLDFQSYIMFLMIYLDTCITAFSSHFYFLFNITSTNFITCKYDIM